MRMIAVAVVVVALAQPALARGSRRPRQPPEFRYVEEADEDRAEELLAPLLRKYATPQKCAGLLKVLRKGRNYTKAVAATETFDYLCNDAKVREFTHILPSKYRSKKPTGVLLFLHGAVRQPPPGGGANEARMFAPAVKRLGLIVVGPSTFGGVGWDDSACRGLISHALASVKRNFNVDENRIYLAGDSDGGRGAYALAETHATLFAAAVPVIGAPGGVERFANLRNLPWFAINGDKDKIFKIDRVRELVDGMKEAGIPLEFKLVEGGGHDPRYFLKYRNEVCNFLQAHPRDPFPKTVHWQMASRGRMRFPDNTIRWLRVEELGSTSSSGKFDDGKARLLNRGLARIQATHEGNRIDVTTSGVKRYTVLLSDRMVDLAQEIEIHTNGKLSFRGKREPHARVILEEMRRNDDRALVFSARYSVKVP